MPSRRKPEFAMDANLEKFKYEVAEEISFNNKKYKGNAATLVPKENK